MGLLSARNHVASIGKRRRHAICIRNSAERNPLNSFACMVSGVSGVSDRLVSPRITSNYDPRKSHSSPRHRISSRALSSCCDRSFQRTTNNIPLSSHLNCARNMSSHPEEETSPPISLANLEFRVSELEGASQRERFTVDDLQNEIWPLLVECASLQPPAYHQSNTRSWQRERIDRAKLSNRILELCVREVEARRLFLWEWLQNSDENASENGDDAMKFSPTAYWKEAPHPTKEMFHVVLSTWKHVIESCSSFSIKSTDAMQAMESSAQQSSYVLSLMEDEHSSDAAFVETYNSRVDAGRYPPIATGAAPPDTRNYGDVIGNWARCIDGSALRPRDRADAPGEDAFPKRLQLEASALKSMMKLLEFMEADLYEGAGDGRSRPPPDRICYNVVLASMARQVNPSLYEMRLVLQKMMERVQFEHDQFDYETDAEDGREDEYLNELILAFFPDVLSYNALIEARANRSAMFASDSDANDQQQQQQQQFLSPRFHSWQQGQGGHLPPRNRRFSSSEEEAILAEHTLEEMSNIATAPVRPNIWSYNAVIKAWVKTDSERGLQRAVMLLRSLALNGHNRLDQHVEEMDTVTTNSGDSTNDDAPSLFGRIANWGASLLGVDDATDGKDDGGSPSAAESRSDTGTERAGKQNSFDLKRIHYKIPSSSIAALKSGGMENNHNESRAHWTGPHTSKRNTQPQMNHVSIGMASRMALIHSAVQGGQGNDSGSSIAAPKSGGMKNNHNESRGKPRAHRTGPHTSKRNTQPQMSHVSIGMTSRMALVHSAVQGGQGNEPSSSIAAPKSGGMENNHNENSEAIGPLPDIEENVVPDLRTFTLVINALERRGTPTSAKLAEDLLHLLEESYFRLDPPITIYNSVLNAWAKTAKGTSGARSSLASARRAEELLRDLLGEGRGAPGARPRPDEYSFLMAINASANAAQAAASAGNHPDGRAAAGRAEGLLKRLRELPWTPSEVTVACHGAVVRTWASLGDADRAQAVLEDMIEASGRVRLDLIHFNAVLDARARDLASARDRDEVIPRLKSVRDLLMKMDSGGGGCNVDPDTSSFNHVIRACYAPWTTSSNRPGDESTRQEAFEIAYDTYLKMSEDYNNSHRPDAHTYLHMFKAIACLLPPSTRAGADGPGSERYAAREAVLRATCEAVLRACCRDGHLAKTTVWTLRRMFPAEERFAELLLSQMDPRQRGETTEGDLLGVPEDDLHANLPAEWSRNGRRVKSLNRHRQ